MTAARKNSTVGRNLEQIWTTEGAHLLGLVGVKKETQKNEEKERERERLLEVVRVVLYAYHIYIYI